MNVFFLSKGLPFGEGSHCGIGGKLQRYQVPIQRGFTHKAREVAPVRDRLVECEGFWPSQDVTIVIVDLYLQGNIQRQFA